MKRRLVFFVVLVLLWSGALGARLYELQVKRHQEFAERAMGQQQRVVELSAPRGTIYDARGRELAVSVEVESVYAVPRDIVDPQAVARSLADILQLPPADLATRLDSDREFAWLARKVEPDVSRRVRDLDLDGIYFLHESRRYYPKREVAAQVLGYVGMDNEGLSGLEVRYEDVLRGGSATRVLLRDARRASVAMPEHPFAEAEPGRDLYLTLDSALQYIAEKELARAVEEAQAKAGVVVVLDPSDSAVLVMASYPSFDPNEFSRYPQEAWRNRAVMDAFEPGSTFKMVTAAAAFDSLLITPDDEFFCENGGIRLGRTYIRDHKPFGLLTYREVIAKSSNVGVIKSALILGDDRLHSAIRAFGFGERTGIDLPGESGGIVVPVESWREASKAYISFGQGISATALQMANAFATLANGGVVHRPYVGRATGRDGELSELPVVRALGRAISPQTAVTLRRVLEGVVNDGGTARRARIPGYRVAGKTGTAQKVLPGGGYSPTGRIASFVGMVPARDPKLVCFVMLDEPRVFTHGGVVAAPVFAATMSQALLYLGVAPDSDLWPVDRTKDDGPRPPRGET